MTEPTAAEKFDDLPQYCAHCGVTTIGKRAKCRDNRCPKNIPSDNLAAAIFGEGLDSPPKPVIK